MATAKWVFTPLTAEEQDQFNRLTGHPDLYNLDDVALSYLVKRGYDSLDKIKSFLNDGIEAFHDIRLMNDAPKAIDIIKDSIEKGELIVVYGDYDADGMGGTSAGVLGLRELGANAHPFTNKRFTEGYGMNKKGVDRLLTLYPDVNLIITVDNGISAHEGVDYANSLGIKVIVTDHHEPSATLPNALAVLDAKRKDNTYPFRHLCGAGLMFKLLCGLAHEMNHDLNPILDLLDIVSISTVADMVPLTGENRIIVREGLKLANAEQRSAFRLLRELSDNITFIDEEVYGFTYGPLFNAIGRLRGEVHEVIEFFLEDDEEKQREMVQKLVQLNTERKDLTATQTELGHQLAESQRDKKVIVLSHPSFHEGIVGLVAGRLKDAYNRPVIVLTNEEGKIKGSGRSIPQLDLKETLDKCADYLENYGGHAPAAGLTVKAEQLEAFTEAIQTIGDEILTDDDLIPVVPVDLAVTPSEVTFDLVESLDILRPFGIGFEKPTIGIKNFQVKRAFYMGSEKQHVKLSDGSLALLMWRESELYRKTLEEPSIVLGLGYPSINIHNGKASIQFVIKDNHLRAQRALSQTA